MPYWLSWLIYIGLLMAAGSTAYLFGFSRGQNKANEQHIKFLEKVLRKKVNDQQEVTVPAGEPVLNSVTGATLGYVREEPDDRP